MKTKHVLMTLCILFVTAACSVSPTIRSNHNQAVEFNAYKTFGFFQPLDTDTRYESLTSQYLKQASVIEMTRRGFVLSNNDPDLLINFHREIQDRQQVNEIPVSVYGGYYGRPYYGSWAGYRTHVTNYQEGKLNIDIVDRKSNKVIWQGEAVGRVNEAQLNNQQAALQKIVAQMFTRFPISAQP